MARRTRSLGFYRHNPEGGIMTQVVQPRLIARAVFTTNASTLAEESIVVSERVCLHPGPGPRREERGLRRGRPDPGGVPGEGAAQLRPEGNQAGLAELRPV